MNQDSFYTIRNAHPEDFGIKDIRTAHFRQGYGDPVPEWVAQQPRTEPDDERWNSLVRREEMKSPQQTIPGLPVKALRPKDIGPGKGRGLEHPDEKSLGNLHWETEDAFGAAQFKSPTEGHPEDVPPPTHEASFGKYTLSRHHSPFGDVIRAWDDRGRHVGGIQLSNAGVEIPGRAVHSLLYVSPEHQGHGVAGAMSRFAQFTHYDDPVKGMGVSPYRTADGDRFTSRVIGHEAPNDADNTYLDSELQDSLVDPNNDVRVKVGAERRWGKQLPLF